MSLPTPNANRPPPPPAPAMETAVSDSSASVILSEHRAGADRQAVGLVFELPRGPYRADKRMPA